MQILMNKSAIGAHLEWIGYLEPYGQSLTVRELRNMYISVVEGALAEFCGA